MVIVSCPAAGGMAMQDSLSLLFSDWCKGAGPAAARVFASQKRTYATRLHFFFQLHRCMRIFEAHRSVCSTVASSPILAVQLPNGSANRL